MEETQHGPYSIKKKEGLTFMWPVGSTRAILAGSSPTSVCKHDFILNKHNPSLVKKKKKKTFSGSLSVVVK